MNEKYMVNVDPWDDTTTLVVKLEKHHIRELASGQTVRFRGDLGIKNTAIVGAEVNLNKEEVVIPEYVAELFEELEQYQQEEFANIEHVLSGVFSMEGGGLLPLDEWVWENPGTYVKFAEAYWAGEGYVAKDPRYTARLNIIGDNIAGHLRSQSGYEDERLDCLELGSPYIKEGYEQLSQFTQYELEKLNIWDNPMWEIEEVV